MTGQQPFAASAREPGSPPWIPGFEPGPLIGLGGHADVFCYTQLAPRRLVAVKVSSVTGGVETSARLWREGEIMASLGDHPGVVHVIMSGQAPDGRTMLVLDYCAGPTLAGLLHRDVLPVADVLEVGIRMAEALAAVHAAGVIHRDIKPANILTTSQGNPRLGDFGLAVLMAETASVRSGMSIPWAAPELLMEEPATPASDIYSLAATIYTALARRAPFQAIDGPNSESDVLSRTLRARLAPIGRNDLPVGLDAVLARALDRNPANRYPDAISLASALAQLAGQSWTGRMPDLMAAPAPMSASSGPREASPVGPPSTPTDDVDATRLRLGVSLTPDRTLPEALAAAVDNFGATRLRGSISLTPDSSEAPGVSLTPFTSAPPATSAGSGRSEVPPPPGGGNPLLPPPPPPPPPPPEPPADPVSDPAPVPPVVPPAQPVLPEAATQLPPPPPSNFVVGPISATGPRSSSLAHVATTIEYPPTKSAARAAQGASPWRWISVVVGAAVVCAAAVGIVWAVIRGGGPQDPAETTRTPSGDIVLVAVPSPSDLVGNREADGSVVFAWTNPNPEDGDRFDWSLTGQGQSDMHEMTSQTTVTIPAAEAGSPTCLEVLLVRADGRFSAQPARGCVG